MKCWKLKLHVSSLFALIMAIMQHGMRGHCLGLSVMFQYFLLGMDAEKLLEFATCLLHIQWGWDLASMEASWVPGSQVCSWKQLCFTCTWWGLGIILRKQIITTAIGSVYVIPVKVDSIFIEGFLELCIVWKTRQDKHKLH